MGRKTYNISSDHSTKQMFRMVCKLWGTTEPEMIHKIIKEYVSEHRDELERKMREMFDEAFGE
jgi:hypothetical protein